MLEFAKRPIDDRLVYFEEVASRRGLTKLIVEKDFWVCITLKLLFETPGLEDVFIFKGGTSLSKVFGIIKRFSEDIDLSVNPNWLGYGNDKSPDKATSRTQFIKRCKELEETCIKAVKNKIQPILQNAFTKILGRQDSGTEYLAFELDQRTKSPILYFNYPTQERETPEYIQPQVKLELGSLTDQEPTGIHEVTSWVAEEFPEEFMEPNFHLISLAPERTFWEKATILHAECHRPLDTPLRHHLSRDIYDVCRMAHHETCERALADLNLLERVVGYKQRYFRSGWANFETAKQGGFRLVPPDHRLQELKSDYRLMQEMFFEEPPDFEVLLEQLRAIEEKINKR